MPVKKQLRVIHSCERDVEIGLLTEKVDRMDKALFGTESKPGITETVIELNLHVRDLVSSSEKLNRTIEGFQIFQAETIGGIKATERNKINLRWAIGTIITALGLAVTITIAYINHSNNQEKQQTVQPSKQSMIQKK